MKTRFSTNKALDRALETGRQVSIGHPDTRQIINIELDRSDVSSMAKFLRDCREGKILLNRVVISKKVDLS